LLLDATVQRALRNVGDIGIAKATTPLELRGDALQIGVALLDREHACGIRHDRKLIVS
jgi:hypothetical protein